MDIGSILGIVALAVMFIYLFLSIRAIWRFMKRQDEEGKRFNEMVAKSHSKPPTNTEDIEIQPTDEP